MQGEESLITIRAMCAPRPRLPGRRPSPLALLLVLALFGASSPAHAGWLHLQSSTGGLPGDNVAAVTEDSTGAVWFGTDVGASRFDGTRWTNVTDSLPVAAVRAILADRAGGVWFGTNGGGLVRHDGRTWRRVDAASGRLPSNQVLALLEDRRGEVWVGTAAGLVRHQPATDQWTRYDLSNSPLPNPIAWRLLEDSAGRLWVAGPQGVSMLDAARSQWTVYRQDPLALGRDSVLCLAEDATGHVWFGTDRGAWRFGIDGWRRFTVADGLPGDVVLAMARDRQGRLWLGGLQGLARTDGASFHRDRVTADGDSIGSVATLTVDSQGALWVGGLQYEYLQAFSRGVFRYDGTTWRNHFATVPGECPPGRTPGVPAAEHLPSDCVVAALEDRSGERWFATADAGVARHRREDTWSALRRAPGVPLSDSLTALVEDAAGRLWFGSADAGVASLDSTRTLWTLHTRANGLPANDVRTLSVDARGDVWVGTGRGAARFHAGAWQRFLDTGATVAEVVSFTEDRVGVLWMSTSLGLYSLDATRTVLRTWGRADGLGDDIVHAVRAASDGSVWFATEGGVSRLRNGAFTTWKSFAFAADSAVLALGEDREGGVWVGTNFATARFDGGGWRVHSFQSMRASSPFTRIVCDSAGTVWVTGSAGQAAWNGRSWRTVGANGEGLASPQTNDVLLDRQGRLWFAGYGGLAEHEPDRVSPQTVIASTPARLAVTRNADFVYGSAFGETADLEYSVSWDDEPFSAWTTAIDYHQTGVPDGRHRFRVRVRDWTGNEDPTPAVFAFEVDATPPLAQIALPTYGQPVRGTVTVTGIAADARFHDFMVQQRRLGTIGWVGPGIQTLAASLIPVRDGALATWSTEGVADGEYEVRLSVTDTLGLYGISTVRVVVDNVAPFADVTAPVRVLARDGGDVFTTASELHAYFPPNALAADAVVTADSVLAAPDSIPSVGMRLGPAWDLAWGDVELLKPATLRLRPREPQGAATRAVEARTTAAVYRLDGASWTRLGGSAQDDGGVALSLTRPGRYALFADAGGSALAGDLSEPVLTPRAWSLTGRFGNGTLAISFTLARPAGVTVKLYNRAGRLVRTVARGVAASPGENLISWNGLDDEGHTLEPGLYLVTVEALGVTRTRTLAVTR